MSELKDLQKEIKPLAEKIKAYEYELKEDERLHGTKVKDVYPEVQDNRVFNSEEPIKELTIKIEVLKECLEATKNLKKELKEELKFTTNLSQRNANRIIDKAFEKHFGDLK